MNKIILGLIAGILFGGLMFVLMLPTIKTESYEKGVSAGIQEGTVNGIEQGRLIQKQYDDSLVIKSSKPVTKAPKRVVKKAREETPSNANNKNYRVYGKTIGEEIK